VPATSEEHVDLALVDKGFVAKSEQVGEDES